MSIKAAAIKASMNYQSSYKYYHQYLKDHHLDDPIQNVITQKQKSELIGYIIDTKMSIKAAAKKANMSESTGHHYYRQHLNHQKRNGHTRRPRVVSASKNEQ
jgi:molybdenum-dependent DNA-binding transcriptional regulator ModE